MSRLERWIEKHYEEIVIAVMTVIVVASIILAASTWK